MWMEMRLCVYNVPRSLSPFQSFCFFFRCRMRLFLFLSVCVSVCLCVLKCLLAVNKNSNIMVICMNVTGQEYFSELHTCLYTILIGIPLANANAHSNTRSRCFTQKKNHRQLGNISNIFPSYLRSNLIPLQVLPLLFFAYCFGFHICLVLCFFLCLIPFHS